MAARAWILLSAWLVGTGWLLSAFHELNRTGYAISFLLAMAIAIGWWGENRWRPTTNPSQAWHKIERRFKRPAPLLFFILAFLALLDGIVYPPLNGDASAYRTPRVLHWLVAEHWYWIRTFDIRFNISSCGIEWLTAPLILFTRSDRLIFLINLISYLLLPGLVYSLFRQLRVSGRVAWWWMWLLPAAFCYALQAGSQSNDSMAAIYMLSAVAFALRARQSGRIGDLWISTLAVALTMGVKQTNVPLVLLWALATLPAIGLVRKHPWSTAAVVLPVLLVSNVPTICLNLLHDCNWIGVPHHPGRDWAAWKTIQASSPFWSFVGNLISIPVQTMAPPFFPMYEHWNNWMQKFAQTHSGLHFASFESFCALPSFVTDQSAGLGLVTSLLLLCSLGWTWYWHKQHGSGQMTRSSDRQPRVLKWLPWVLLAFFMTQVTSYQSARQLSPYYPFLLPVILGRAGMLELTRQTWWQRCSIIAMTLSAIFLVITPQRPLLPVKTVLDRIAANHPSSYLIDRARSCYSAPEMEVRYRWAFKAVLPPNEAVAGYASDATAGLELGLWFPFQRRAKAVLPDDTRQILDAAGIHYVVVDRRFLALTGCSIEAVAGRFNAEMVNRVPFPQGWQRPPEYWYVLRLKNTAN